MIIQNGVGITSLLNGETLKQSLNPANETVGKGIYSATTLSAVDGDLAVGNIKNGITLFGFAGVATVQDIADADAVVGGVKAGQTFYSVTGARKTGTLATVALSAAANSYPAGYHAGAASLTAVDGDLVAGNIADGITIFGVLGTFTGGALAEDVVDSDITTEQGDVDVGGAKSDSVDAGADHDMATNTSTYDASSMTVAVGFASARSLGTDGRLRLYMDGVQEAEVSITSAGLYILVATRALSGSAICKIAYHNYDGVARTFRAIGSDTSGGTEPVAAGIGVGSIKN